MRGGRGVRLPLWTGGPYVLFLSPIQLLPLSDAPPPPPILAAWSLCLLLVLFLNSCDFDGVLGGRALRASGQSVIFNWMSSVYSLLLLLLLKPMAHLSGYISLLLHLTVFRFRSPNIRQFILA